MLLRKALHQGFSRRCFSSRVVDLRSDTLTAPSQAMKHFGINSLTGDDVLRAVASDRHARADDGLAAKTKEKNAKFLKVRRASSTFRGYVPSETKAVTSSAIEIEDLRGDYRVLVTGRYGTCSLLAITAATVL